MSYSHRKDGQSGPRLPALAALRAFEAAARHGSFARAAEELFVTPSAISHQIRALEATLGLKLFERTGPKLRLTEQGQLYFPHVFAAFDLLGAATREVQSHGTVAILTLATMDSFAANWLLPRLRDFADRHPDIDIRISPANRSVNLIREGFDMAVRYGDGAWAGVQAELFLSERVFPVCSRRLRRVGPPLEGPADLRHHRLLHQTNQMSWHEWLRRAAVGDRVDAGRGPTFERSYLALQAAADGQGVALASGPLVIDALAEGRLECPFGPRVTTGLGYYMVYPEIASQPAKVVTFRDWLLTERDRVLDRLGKSDAVSDA